MKDSVINEYKKVKIEGILNFKEFSAEYEMTPEELLSFHNKHCSFQELLTLSLPKYVEYVYIPSDKFETRDQKLLKNTTLDLPVVSSEKTYGVVIKFLPKNLQIHYRIKIKRTPFHLELTKEKTYVNNQEIDKVIEQLFEKAEQVLYPLQMSVKKDGGLENIINHEQIANRWKTDCLPKMKDYYQSEITDQILTQFNQAYANLNLKKEMFERNIFYKMFFLPVFRGYTRYEASTDLNVYFSSLNKNVQYNTKYLLNKEYTKGGKIALKIEGNEEENGFNKGENKGELNFLYKLEKNTYEIFSIAGYCTVYEREQEHKVHFEMYKLNNS
ncbi:hypothetical protein [Chryseobacterium sp. NKUCC03_KSP]|uniref:hypothetical protein n=1 Tax=Chryseobacterium sp. NKUCC03_KSP TaxID=2842125 RepID=UPI001C5BB5A9|nr:hypothetical protein [Chryseobacterium sp. NKUCC03_KSP]MBW3524069.1 hypothetical protein [Chryseobacterium sp. NKUCC03_KSP]